MAHEFELTGNIYVSKSGNNGNAGTDANSPKLDAEPGLDALSASQSVIVGSGLYENDFVNANALSKRVLCDGVVVFKGNGANTMFNDIGTNTDTRLEDALCIDYNYFMIKSNGTNMSLNCQRSKFVNGKFQLGNAGDNKLKFIECIFVNCTITLNSFTDRLEETFDRCLFFGCTLNGNTSEKSMINCYADASTTVDGFELLTNCMIRGTKTNIGSDVNPLASADPLFLGDPTKLEVVVAPNSPLVGSGTLGQNIGGVKTGKVQKNNTLEWGLSPLVNDNTRFDSNNALEVITGNVGDRESKEIDMGQVVKGAVIRLNGITDFLNNVPDFATLSNPNHLTLEISYAGLDKSYTAYKAFKWNRKIMLDTGGKSTGESGFDWGNTVDVSFRYIKVRVTVRNNYVAA